MADQKRKHHRLSKGDKVSVLVEEALDDVIIVTLKSGTKEFRGILLDCNKRNIPHGVCFDSLPNKRDKPGENGVNSLPTEQIEGDHMQNSVSASTHRFTYNHDPITLTEKVVLPQPKGNIRPVRSKAVRDIRLRPRQTLCSKCKNMIHENSKNSTGKSLSPKQSKTASNVPKPHLSPSRHLNRPKVTLKWGLRKRKYQQDGDSLEKEKVTKKSAVAKPQSSRLRERSERQTRRSVVEHKIAQAKETFPEVRLYKLEDVRKELESSQESLGDRESNGKLENKEETTCDETEHTDDVDSATDSSSKFPKPTPIIKISFGDGAVLKIPPRLPGAEIEEHVESSSEEIHQKRPDPQIENMNYVTHKKLKKAMKKSKERMRNRSGDHENFDEKADKHHRKHKRKHKHKRVSPYESRPLESNTNVIVSDCNANEEKDLKNEDGDSLEKEPMKMDIKVRDWIEQISNDEDDENSAPVQEEVRPNRPRLLYTWNTNRGLSRVDASPREIQCPLEEKLPPEDQFSPQEKLPPERIPPDIVMTDFSPDRFFGEQHISPEQRFPFEEQFQPNPLQDQLQLMPRTPQKEILYSPYEVQKESPFAPFNAAPAPMIVGMGPYSPISSASEPSEDTTDIQLPETMHFGESAHMESMNLGVINSQEAQLESEDKNAKPLMMKIQTQNVPKCVIESGRQLHVGDIVWGKIQGFPWWPGRIISITVTQKDNGIVIAQIAHVTWFASSTMSHMQCSELYPFLEDFKLKFNKKKRGPYRVAIKQATTAAQESYSQSDHHIDLTDLDDYKSS